MTTYNGTNMGLEQKPDGTWEFTNPAQTFIDPASFSTPDPDFPYHPEPDDDDQEEDKSCEEGYIYDETLKKCVPEVTTFAQKVAEYTGDEKDEIPGTGRPMPQIPEYLAGVTGARALVPKEDIAGFDDDGNPIPVTEPGSAFDQSGIDYKKLFPYETTARTRAQMNEHMLIAHGLDKGWIAFDDEKNAYRKVQYQEQIHPKDREKISSSWGLQLLSANSYGSYNDYFEILEKGWQPSSDQNVWKKLIQGNAKYSLTGGMIYKDKSTRGGRGSDVTYIGYSEDRTITGPAGQTTFIKGFRTKVNEAMAIPNGMIDRDGNVNVNAGDGGYYDEDGKFVDANGQVHGSGSLINGIQYLLSLKNSGLKLPENLKKRLLKSLGTQVMNKLSLQEREQIAKQYGYNSWNLVQSDINTAINDTDSWSATDVVTDVTKDVTDIGTQPGIPFVGRDTQEEQAQEVERVEAASKKSIAPVLTREEREGGGGYYDEQQREESERQMRDAAQRESQAISRGDKQQARQAREEYKTAVERGGHSRF